MIKRTAIPIQDTKKECMEVLNKKKARLVNDENYMRNPDYTLGTYLTTAKVEHCRLVAENKIEKLETKKETAKKTLIRKFHL